MPLALQRGINGHVEGAWCQDDNALEERIVQFSFQVTRTNEEGLSLLADKLDRLLTDLKARRRFTRQRYLPVLYQLIGFTRDIVEGKGEYTLAYMMIYVWYRHFPELATFALKCFVSVPTTRHPYGSWKDIKYFCNYCCTQPLCVEWEELISYAISLLNEQLQQDVTTLLSSSSSFSSSISLAAKWAPREKSAFGWLYDSLAANYFVAYLQTADTDERKAKAISKCKMHYRKVLSFLNRHLDTLQVKQCAKRWTDIDFHKVTSVSLMKQRKAFLHEGSDEEDRRECAQHLRQYIATHQKEIKGQRVSIADFTKQARHLLRYPCHPEQRALLNAQWQHHASQNGVFNHMIAMVDGSAMMSSDALNAGIALAIRIAEKSVLGNRVMVFGAEPAWLSLDDCPDFVAKVDTICQAMEGCGMNANFVMALDLILQAIAENAMHPQDVRDMVLVILSDMQVEMEKKSNQSTLFQVICEKYAATGIRVHGTPYKPPHIVFWNLRSTNGFPCGANEPNTSMLSGFSPHLLNVFCDEGIDMLHGCSPWTMLQKSLRSDRYKILQLKIDSVL